MPAEVSFELEAQVLAPSWVPRHQTCVVA